MLNTVVVQTNICEIIAVTFFQGPMEPLRLNVIFIRILQMLLDCLMAAQGRAALFVITEITPFKSRVEAL